MNPIVMGDFNSIVVEVPFGFGTRHERGKMLIIISRHYDLVLINTWVKKRRADEGNERNRKKKNAAL